jgi:hypothetical protein
MTLLKRIGGPLMKKFLVVAVILLGFSTMSMAQEFSRAEVLGGYSFLRCDNTILGAPGQTCSYMGWKAAVNINGNKWLGFTADVGGAYATIKDSTSVYTILVGPRFTVRKGPATPFVQALLGDARVSPGQYFSYDNSFAMALGGGIDISVNDKLAVRPFQFEYLGIKSEKPITDNYRFSFGIIYKIGSHK